MVRVSDIAFLIAPLVFGTGVSKLLTPSTFRQCGVRPRLQPPGWVFGVTWVVLYCLVGVAGMLAWRRFGRRWNQSLIAYILAISMMISWWIIFANWCFPRAAFICIVIVLAAVTASVALLYQAGAVISALLSLPLMAWLCFASYLSYASI